MISIKKIFSSNERGLETEHQRINRILEILLVNTFANKAITQAVLAEEMFISLSTFKLYLMQIKILLDKYHLKIVQYKLSGIKISGNEKNMRYFIAEYCNSHKSINFYKKIFDVNIQKLDVIIKNVLNKKNLQLTDAAQSNLCMLVAIAIQRSKNNYQVSYLFSMAQKIEESFEYDVAKDIILSIYKKIGIDIYYGEAYYLAQCLLASKKVLDTGKTTLNKEHVKYLLEKILRKIKETLSIDFMHDKYLIDGLTLHLNIALTRIQFEMNIDNELLKTIKNDYPLAFQMGVIAGKVVEQVDKVTINENEIGYIALHFGAALSRNGINKQAKAKRVILVCSAGLGIAVLLKAKIEEHFRQAIDIDKIVPGYSVTESILDDIDYVFTTVPLHNIKSDKIINLHHMLQRDDIEKIERVVLKKKITVKSDIIEFFSASNFYVNKNFHNKDECLYFLTNEAVKKKLMTPKTKESVIEREALSSTSIGELIAIPHPIYNDINSSFISICVLDEPIDWNGFLVQVVFLLNIEKEKSQLWEEVFLKLYDYMKNNNGVKNLLQTKSFAVFIKKFIESFQEVEYEYRKVYKR